MNGYGSVSKVIARSATLNPAAGELCNRTVVARRPPVRHSWSRSEVSAADGIPRYSVVTTARTREPEFVLRDFDVIDKSGTRVADVAVERPTVLAVGTDADRPADQFRAGAALGRLVLSATSRGAAASPLGQVVDVSSARALLGAAAGGAGHVQMLLRVGYPDPAADHLMATPRRPVDDVLDMP